MYTRDWYMRQVELMVQFIAKVFFRKPIPLSKCEDLADLLGGDDEDDGGGAEDGGAVDAGCGIGEGAVVDSAGEGAGVGAGAQSAAGAKAGRRRANALRRELAQMIEGGQINEAEDRLFDNLGEGDRDMLAVAVAFYVRLNQLEDITLASCAYTREEINEGLKDALRVYGATPDLLFRS